MSFEILTLLTEMLILPGIAILTSEVLSLLDNAYPPQNYGLLVKTLATIYKIGQRD